MGSNRDLGFSNSIAILLPMLNFQLNNKMLMFLYIWVNNYALVSKKKKKDEEVL